MFANLQGRTVPVDEKSSCKRDYQNEQIKGFFFLRERLRGEKEKKNSERNRSMDDNCHRHDYDSAH
jgi:hypothetical protein